MKAILNNKSGFTLLEALVSLMITTITLLLLVSGLNQIENMNDTVITGGQTIANSTKQIRGERQIEWHIFLNQLELYLTDSEFVEIQRNQLIVNEWNEDTQKEEPVKYHQAQTGSQSFRRSKYNGNNTMLTDIEKVNLMKNEQYLILSFTFKNGEKYMGRIWIDSWKEKKEDHE